MDSKNLIFNNKDIHNKIKRISLEVYEEVFNDKKLTVLTYQKTDMKLQKKLKIFSKNTQI